MPQLGLSYNSGVAEDVRYSTNDSNGWENYHGVQASPFGYGWDLDGIPVIAQVPRVDSFGDGDDAVQGGVWGDDDFGYELSLGGQKIRLVKPVRDDNGAITRTTVFQTYPQSFLHVRRRQEYAPQAITCNSQNTIIEDRWIINARDGTRFEFGSNDNLKRTGTGGSDCHDPVDRDAIQVMHSLAQHDTQVKSRPGRWYATRISDTRGNEIQLAYRRESSSSSGDFDTAVTPMTITYGISGDNRSMVRLVPQSGYRIDCRISVPDHGDWVCEDANPPSGSGAVYRSRYLIDRIEVLGRDAGDYWIPTRVYSLTYAAQGPITQAHALLASVTIASNLLTTTGVVALPAYTMTYDTPPQTTTFANWLPLKRFWNGYGGNTYFDYRSEADVENSNNLVTCRRPGVSNPLPHRRRPVITRTQTINIQGNELPVSANAYAYTGGRCTEIFADAVDEGYGSIYFGWYEFLGFRFVTDTLKDLRQTTSSGDDTTVSVTADQYYQCTTDDSTTCKEDENGDDPVEPHPVRGAIKFNAVHDPANNVVNQSSASLYSVVTLEKEYYVITSTVSAPTTWGRLDREDLTRTALADAVGSGYDSVVKVITYTYDISKQGGAQFGNVTDSSDFASFSQYQGQAPVRTRRTWFVPSLQFPGGAPATYIVDRPVAEAAFKGFDDPAYGGQLTAATWKYYDGRDFHTDGPNKRGEVTRIMAVTSKESQIPISWTECTTSTYLYKTEDHTFRYSDAGNVISDTTFGDLGWACVITGTAYRAWPTQPHAKLIGYDTLLQVFPISETSPALPGDLKLTTRRSYFGVNGPLTTSLQGYAFGQMEKITEANGAATTYEYDAIGRPKRLIRPGDSITSPTEFYHYYDDQLSPPFPSMREVWKKREDNAQPITYGGAFHRIFFDGLGREIEHQWPHASWGGGSVGEDALYFSKYDARGLMAVDSNKYLKPTYVHHLCNGKSCSPYVLPDESVPVITNSYDVMGRPLTTTQPTILSNVYIQHHYGVSTAETPRTWIDDVTDQNRHRKQQRTDSLGRLVKVLEITGDCSSSSYFGSSSNCSGGFETEWTTSGATEYSYDLLDRLTRITDQLGAASVITYNLAGRKTVQNDPDMGVWAYSYDGAGNLKTQTDARGQVVCLDYDALDRPTRKRYSANADCSQSVTATLYYYDESAPEGLGHRTSMDDSTSTGQTEWTYDSRGRVERISQFVYDPNYSDETFTTEYQYKSNDSVKRMDFPDDQWVTYAYNPLSLSQMEASQAPTMLVANTSYMPSGQVDYRILGFADSDNRLMTDYQYDSRNNRLRAIITGGGPSRVVVQWQLYEYDHAGNVKSVWDNINPRWQGQKYSHDHLDRLTYGTTTGPEPIARYSENISYTLVGNIDAKGDNRYVYHPTKKHAVRRVYGSGATSAVEVSVTARRAVTTSSCTSAFELFINGTAQSTVTFSSSSYVTHTFDIADATGQDVYDIRYGASCQINVDAVTVGGRRIETESGVVASDSGQGAAAFDGLDMAFPTAIDDNGTGAVYVGAIGQGSLRFVLGSPAGAYEYDANGNVSWRIADGHAHKLLWDEENRLDRIGQGNTLIASFGYNGDGTRIISTFGATTTTYIGDYYEMTRSNWGTGETKYFSASGTRVAMRRTGYPADNGLYWILGDQLGSTTQVVSSTAPTTVHSEERYKPFGQTRYERSATVGASGVPTTRRFTGQVQEGTLGLYFYNARYYDPQIGRFVAADTIVPNPSDPQDLNRYSYAKNNPIRFSDPSGNFCVPCVVVVGVIAYTAWDYLSHPDTSYAPELNIDYSKRPASDQPENDDALCSFCGPASRGEWTSAVVLGAIEATPLDEVPGVSRLINQLPLPGMEKLAAKDFSQRLAGLSKEWHHVATNKHDTKWTDRFQQLVSPLGLNVDDHWNQVYIPHRGSHPNEYHQWVYDGMTRIVKEANGRQDLFLELYERQVKRVVREHPEMLFKEYWR